MVKFEAKSRRGASGQWRDLMESHARCQAIRRGAKGDLWASQGVSGGSSASSTYADAGSIFKSESSRTWYGKETVLDFRILQLITRWTRMRTEKLLPIPDFHSSDQDIPKLPIATS